MRAGRTSTRAEGAPSSSAPAHQRLRAAWALALATLLALLFTGMTALTLTLWAAGPSCFLGQCAHGDRYAEAAALALGIVAVALLAAVRPPGWRLPAWSVAAAAVVLGGASLAFPGEVGSLGTAGATATVAWGVTLAAVAEREHRRTPRPDARVRERRTARRA